MAKKSKFSEYTTKITAKVGIYEKASTSSIKIGYYEKGTIVTVKSETPDSNGNTWAANENGYFMIYNNKTKKKYTKGKSGANDINVISPTGVNSTKKGSWKETANQINQLKKFTQSELNTNGAINKTMQLFGIPYQFLDSVDTRVKDINKILGRKYIKNFILDSPVVTIMPGKPKYLPGTKDKTSMTQAFMEASVGSLGALKQLQNDADMTGKDLKLYDFQTAYIEYMQYVNILCRACAAFLELDRNSDDEMYKVNDEYPSLLSMDWKDYRWEGKKYQSSVGAAASSALDGAKKTIKSKFGQLKDFGSSIMSYMLGEDNSDDDSGVNKFVPNYDPNSTKGEAGIDRSYSKDGNLDVTDNTTDMSNDELTIMETLGRKVHYVQFYCDPNSTNFSESVSNSTQQSTFKGMLDSASSAVKEVSFLADSGGVDSSSLQKLGESLIKAVGDIGGALVGGENTSAGTLLSRVTSFGQNIIKGDNIMMPDIYSGSSRSASISITIPLKCVYGNKYSYYFDYLVPLMHLLALALPRATSANSYTSPFLVKAFMKGVFNCNLGIVDNISVQHEEYMNADGLYMGGTVTLSITDLYPDMAMTPANHPLMFVNNTSLIDYLATQCGLNLLENKFSTKVQLFLENFKNMPSDIIDSEVGKVGQKIDDLLYSFTGL